VFKQRLRAMAADMQRALRHRQFVWVLAKKDIFAGTHLTILGPVWLVLQPLLWILAMFYLVQPTLPNQKVNYQLYIAIGVILYSSVQTFITGGTQVFVREKGLILNVALPLSVFAFKNAARVVIEMLIMSPIILVTMIFYPPASGPAMFLAIPGLLILFVFGFGVTLALGTLSARFADVIYMTQALMRVMLFVTPVFWLPDLTRGPRLLIANLNPLYHLLAVVRDPLMGKVPPLIHYQIAIPLALTAFVVGLLLFTRFRGRVPVWI
jgi:ABC-type polysaccharide/polyol phosphate export permease